MAHKITAIVAPKPGQAAPAEIPQEIKDEIDGLYDHLRQNPGLEGYAEFDTPDEMKEWQRLAASYCKFREAGALKLRKLPAKNLPDNHMRFQLTADLPANGERESK